MVDAICAMAFRYRTLSDMRCKLRNLCLYNSGNGLDWRREVPLSDNHRGTAFVALDTEWTGGRLLLRRNGIEIRLDMQRQTVFFDSETEYAIEPVTDGNMVLLHYDVLVYDYELNRRVELGEDDEYPDDMGVNSEYECLFMQQKNLRSRYKTEEAPPRGFLYGADHEKRMDYVLRIVKKLLITKHDTVGLTLHHQYGEHRILPEFLEQPDTWYDAVARCGFLDVSLRPILLHQQTGAYGMYGDPVAYPYDQHTSNDGEVEEVEVASDVPESAVLFLHGAAALTRVVFEEYIENYRSGDQKYFAWAMFLRLRDDEM